MFKGGAVIMSRRGLDPGPPEGTRSPFLKVYRILIWSIYLAEGQQSDTLRYQYP